MSSEKYQNIIDHYEKCFIEHGDTPKGLDWPNQKDLTKRYNIMLDFIDGENCSLLDFGCGTAGLLDHINEDKNLKIKYSGLDLGELFIERCINKFPKITFYNLDILKEASGLPMFDYIIMNGVFTEKRNLTQKEMMNYFKLLLKAVFGKCKKAIAFNVMSDHVDWKRNDLFHLPYDTVASFLCEKLSRNFTIRNDYGLYEYTVYVYKNF